MITWIGAGTLSRADIYAKPVFERVLGALIENHHTVHCVQLASSLAMPHSVSTSSLSSQEQVLTQDNDSVQSNEPETARQPDGGDDVAMEESRDASDSPALPDVQDLDMADSFDDDHMDDDEWLKSAAAEEAKHELASSAPYELSSSFRAATLLTWHQ